MYHKLNAKQIYNNNWQPLDYRLLTCDRQVIVTYECGGLNMLKQIIEALVPLSRTSINNIIYIRRIICIET